METYQITGEMVATNVELLNNPLYNAYGDMFKAIMDTNLMDFRLLKNGVAELSYAGPAERTRLTPEYFVESLTALMGSKNIPALGFTGQFLCIRTGEAGTDPVVTKIVVNKGEVAHHEGMVIWNVKE